MGKKKSTVEQKNTYTQIAPVRTAEVDALSKMKAVADPSIPFAYGKMRQAQADSFNNPLGSATTPAVREASARATNQSLAQMEAQAQEESQFNADNANFGRQATVAGFTQPQTVQSGGTQTTTQQGGFWGGLLQSAIGAGSNVGAAAMM
jgi:hypothetical protein